MRESYFVKGQSAADFPLDLVGFGENPALACPQERFSGAHRLMAHCIYATPRAVKDAAERAKTGAAGD